jgi:signal peptidase
VRRAAALLLAVLASWGLLVAGAGEAPSSHIAVVKGRSMEPILHTGDIVLLHRPPPDKIKPGDVVVYMRGGGFVIHRVIKVYKRNDKWCYVVWGDNRATNPVPDPGDPIECGTILLRVPSGEGSQREYVASGIPYYRIVGVVVTLHGHIFKVPYLGGLSLLVR